MSRRPPPVPSSSSSDHWTQRKVTGKRKVTVDAEKSDGKKKSDRGRREK